MQDRVPTPGQEGRVLITPENGSPYYAKIEMADNPTQAGTALNKATLLQDITAKIYGLDDTAVVNDVLQILGMTVDTDVRGYIIRVVGPNGTPIQGATVSGITPIATSSAVTDEDGYMVGYSSSNSVSVSVTSPYIDLNGATQTVTSTGIVTNAIIPLQEKSGMITVTSTQTLKFSGAVQTADFCVCGGGGGGGGGGRISTRGYLSGGGGAGGYVVNQLNVEKEKLTSVSVQIGAGGAGGTYGYAVDAGGQDGGNGGTTSVALSDGSVITAGGGGGGEGAGTSAGTSGVGGTGAANGGNGGTYSSDATWNPRSTAGADSHTYIFGNTSYGLAGGGGGGGGTSWLAISPPEPSKKIGGDPGGGAGALNGYYDNFPYADAENGDSAAGGGGGAWSNGGNGGNGVVYIRCHF